MGGMGTWCSGCSIRLLLCEVCFKSVAMVTNAQLLFITHRRLYIVLGGGVGADGVRMLSKVRMV